MDISLVIVSNETAFRRRFNFKRFTNELDVVITNLELDVENYNEFVQRIRKVTQINTPRGCRTKYVPGLTPVNSTLYGTNKASYILDLFAENTISLGKQLMDAIEAERR